MAQQCPSCNIDLAEDPSRGELFCPRCGEVFEENRVVSEVGFQETGRGVAVVGQRIPTSTDGARAGQTSESREQSLAKGNAKIEWVGQLLKLSNHIQEAAKRIFLLAVQRNFTKGRRTVHVAAACLYVQCRLNRTPHMLIDFSDVLQASVRVLGQCYMKLVRLLNLDNQVVVPLIDPSFFMERFASQMNFGNLQQKVAMTATRMVQAMKRDWIVTGRRPTGLCGAALMISAQYHGEERSAADIAEVVRMGEVTLKKRLFEFRQTSTAALTTDEFEKLDFKPAEDWNFKKMPITDALPPSLVRNRHKEVKLQALKDEEAQLALADVEAAAKLEAIEDGSAKEQPKALEDGSAKEEVNEKEPKVEPNENDPKSDKLDLNRPIEIEEDGMFDDPKDKDIENIAKKMSMALAARAEASVKMEKEKFFAEGVKSEEASASAKQTKRVKSETNETKTLKIGLDHLMENMPSIDVENAPQSSSMASSSKNPPPQMKREISHSSNIVVKNAVKADVVTIDEDARTETLSDVDDTELDQYLLADNEMRAKADIWHEVNRDFLQEWEIREQNKKRTAEKNADKPPTKRPARRLQPAANPLEGAKQALERKQLNKRIDASALEDLFNL
eukprot:gene954-1159_t